MPSRRFRRELAQELPSWQERGWLTADAAKALRDTYELDRPAPKTGSIILACLGSALLLGGLILVFAHNWEDLGRPLRGLLSLLPLMATVALTFRSLRRHPDSVAAAEGLGIANSLALCLAISLVAQTYQISGDLPRFLLTWSVFTLGIAYILGSGLTLVVHNIIAVAWAWSFRNHPLILPGYLALAAGSLPFLHRRVWGTLRPGTCQALPLPLFLCFTGALAAPLCDLSGGGWYLTAFAVWFALCYIIADAPSRPLGAGLRWLAAIGLSVVLLTFSFREAWTQFRFDGYGQHWTNAGSLAATVLLLGLHAALACVAVYRRRSMDLSAWLWFGAGFVGFFAWLVQPSTTEASGYMVGTNLFVAALALSSMILGIQQMNTLRTNLGWLLLSALILCRFFDSELSYLVRGLAFIALGLGFLGLNLFLLRRQRNAEDAAKAPSSATGKEILP